MTSRVLLAATALSLAVSGCSLDGSLAAYCERTGECACTDGDCCTTEGGECSDAWGCCAGLTCDGSRCVVRYRPLLSFSPEAVDLGRSPPLGATGAPVTLVLRNDGSGPTTEPVQVLPGADGFVVDASGCAGRILQPNTRCELTVAARPTAFGTFRMTLIARAGRDHASASVQYSAGSTVAVTLAGGGVGTISSVPPGIHCPPDCSGTFDDGEVISLTAEVPAGSEFRGFQGGPCDGGTTCAFPLDGGVSVAALVEPWLQLEVTQDPWYRESRLQVAGQECLGRCGLAVAGPQTVEAVAGHLSGLEAWTGACADAGMTWACTVDVQGPTTVGATFAAANRVSVVYLYPHALLSGDFLAQADAACGWGARAWLLGADGMDGLTSRFGSARGWINVRGQPFADTLETLLQGQVFHPVDPGASYSRVATGGIGIGPATDDCLDWTTPDAGYVGGIPYAGGSTWVEEPGVLGDCAMYLPVYCFENTRRVRVTPRSEKTKLAFLSSPWRPGGGVDAADRHCTEEAQAHGLTGTYVAAVQTPTKGPAARLSTLAEHRRLDQVELGSAPPLNVLADGGYLRASAAVEDGAYAWTGDATSHCAYWTSNAGDGRVGRPDFPRDRGGMGTRLVPCDSAQRLYCLQQ